jgi:hypothetical protein
LERLLKELKELQEKPDLDASKVIGAVIASAVRFRQLLEERALGMQALAASVAMQPQLDAEKLHADFIALVKEHFGSARTIPAELRDLASAIKLAAAERK